MDKEAGKGDDMELKPGTGLHQGLPFVHTIYKSH